MPTVHENVLTLILDDITLSALLSGGVFDYDNIDDIDRGGMDWSPKEDDGIRLAPHAKLRWGTVLPHGENILLAAEEESLDIYIYQDIGYTVIDAVAKRLKELLHTEYVTGDDVGLSFFTFANLTNQTNAEELNDASLRVMTFQNVYIR